MNPILCPCGSPAEPELVELSAMFPAIYPRPLCRACSDIRDAEVQAANARLRESREMDLRRSRLIATVPAEMIETDPSHPTFNLALWNRISGWSPDTGKWLGIHGGAGRCKTRCVALLVRRLTLDGVTCAWTTACEIQRLTEVLNCGDDSDRRNSLKTLETYRHARVLVLDDIGKNTWTPTFERKLFEILDYRKTKFKSVIWTANTHPIELLRHRLLSDDRSGPIVGRIIEVSQILAA